MLTTAKKEMLDYLVVIMGGRIAEEIVPRRHFSSGAAGDIQQATRWPARWSANGA